MAAIQIFNNPLISFKSEAFIVLMNIAWTYLLHAYYKEKKIEYRYFDQKNQRKLFHKTKAGSYKYWELEQCLKNKDCPLDKPIQLNLLFLIGIRHEIEHSMTNKIDLFISAKLQACCINYNDSLKKLFGINYALDKIIPLALQLFSFGENQIEQLKNVEGLPKNVIDFISQYEANLLEISDSRYSYRVIYIRDNVNKEGHADSAYRLVDEESSEGKKIHNILLKHKQFNKLTQNNLLKKIKELGYSKFEKQNHLNFWRSKWPTAKQRNLQAKQYGELVLNNQWLWFEEKWLPIVLEECRRLYGY